MGTVYLYLGGMVPSTPFFVAASDFFGELRVVVGGVVPSLQRK